MEPNRSIDRRRLDVVLAEIARTATDPATRAQVHGFEALLRTRYEDSQRPAFDSMREALADFIMPRIGNSSILHSAQYMEILGHLVEQILPSLGESDEIIEIAIAVIDEEMERHRELQDRIHEALSA